MITKDDILKFLFFYFLYFFFLLFARFLLPYGDEPDFGYRVYSILHVDKIFLNPFLYFEESFSLFDWYVDVESVSMKFFRVTWTFGLISFSAFVFFVLSFFYFINKSYLDRKVACHSINILCLAMLFPSVWFHLGFLAEEQFTLILSLFSMLFRRHFWPFFLIGLYISLIDFGNSLVYFTFLIFVQFFSFLIKRYGGGRALFCFLLIVIAVLIIKMEFLKLFFNFPVVGDKAFGVYDAYTNIYDINDKYPLILRPVITLLSLVLMFSQAQVLFIVPYFLVFLVSSSSLWRTYRLYFLFKKDSGFLNDFPFFLAALMIILFFPIVLPGHSNGKYYVFIIPYYLLFLSYTIRLNFILFFILLLNFFVFLQLFLSEFLL